MNDEVKTSDILNNPFTLFLMEQVFLFSEDIPKRKGFSFDNNNRNLLTKKEVYLLNIQSYQFNLNIVVEQIEHIEVYIRRFPQKKYLEENNINQLAYIQYHTEVLAHKVHTVLEIMKLLVNEVYKLGIAKKKCSWINLIEAVDKEIPPMKLIARYYSTFKNLIELRNLNTHRGYFIDKSKNEIELKFGLSLHDLNKNNKVKTDLELSKLFPKYLIKYKIKEHRKQRLNYVKTTRTTIIKLVQKFLTTLESELLNQVNKYAP